MRLRRSDRPQHRDIVDEERDGRPDDPASFNGIKKEDLGDIAYLAERELREAQEEIDELQELQQRIDAFYKMAKMIKKGSNLEDAFEKTYAQTPAWQQPDISVKEAEELAKESGVAVEQIMAEERAKHKEDLKRNLIGRWDSRTKGRKEERVYVGPWTDTDIIRSQTSQAMGLAGLRKKYLHEHQSESKYTLWFDHNFQVPFLVNGIHLGFDDLVDALAAQEDLGNRGQKVYIKRKGQKRYTLWEDKKFTTPYVVKDKETGGTKTFETKSLKRALKLQRRLLDKDRLVYLKKETI